MSTNAAAARMMSMQLVNQSVAHKTHKAIAKPVQSFNKILQSAGSDISTSSASSVAPPASTPDIQAILRSTGASSLTPAAKGASSTSEDEETTSQAASSHAYASEDDLISSFAGRSGNKIQAADWVRYRPEGYTDAQFQDAINEMNYRYSLLDEDALPYGLTRPEEGFSRSTDVARTEFVESPGGVHRLDYNSNGDKLHLTFIPVTEWKMTSKGASDPIVGNVYSLQTPFGFVSRFVRDGAGAPSGYSADAYTDAINSYLAEG